MTSRSAVPLRLRGRGERLFQSDAQLLVSRRGEAAPSMASAREVVAGDFLAISYREMWNSEPSPLPALPARPRYGSEKGIDLPTLMSHELALFLGAYLSEGYTQRSTWSVVITNSVLDVLEQVRASAEAVFGLRGRICEPPTRCSYLVISSKRLVEFMDLLGCGCRASEKRVPAVMMKSSREHILTFMRGVALDAYSTHEYAGKWGICLESAAAINEIQDLMTMLGIANAQIPKLNRKMGKTYYELYAAGPWGQEMCRLVPFLEPDKAARAGQYLTRRYRTSSTDLIPGVTGPELYALVPCGKSGRNGRGTGRQSLRHLCDPRTRRVTRSSLERARAAGASLPPWLVEVLDTPMRFVEVV
jgi:hypothetical protein